MKTLCVEQATIRNEKTYPELEWRFTYDAPIAASSFTSGSVGKKKKELIIKKITITAAKFVGRTHQLTTRKTQPESHCAFALPLSARWVKN